MNVLQITPSLLCILLVTVTLGCGNKDYELAPVSGRVTIDGKPISGVYVSFQPVAQGDGQGMPGPGSMGVTDEKGAYTLQTLKPKQAGAVVGPHVVRMELGSKQKNVADDFVATFQLPTQCRDGSIKFTVPPEGSDKADFELSAP